MTGSALGFFFAIWVHRFLRIAFATRSSIADTNQSVSSLIAEREVLAGFTAACEDIFTMRFVRADRNGRLLEMLGSANSIICTKQKQPVKNNWEWETVMRRMVALFGWSAILSLLVLASARSVLAAELTDAEKKDGFVSLFNGKDLTGWVGATTGYVAEGGNLVCLKEKGGNLYTKDEYSDFIFRFEFKLEPGANNGLGIRAPQGCDAAYCGMELQILDDSAEVYKNLKPYQYHGSIYGVAACKRGHQKKVGEWNVQEVVVKGRQVKVILNGETIVDADIDKESTPKTADGQNHPGLKRDKGYIGFLGHGARIEFRNIRIKDLAEKK